MEESSPFFSCMDVRLKGKRTPLKWTKMRFWSYLQFGYLNFCWPSEIGFLDFFLTLVLETIRFLSWSGDGLQVELVSCFLKKLVGLVGAYLRKKIGWLISNEKSWKLDSLLEKRCASSTEGAPNDMNFGSFLQQSRQKLCHIPSHSRFSVSTKALTPSGPSIYSNVDKFHCVFGILFPMIRDVQGGLGRRTGGWKL